MKKITSLLISSTLLIVLFSFSSYSKPDKIESINKSVCGPIVYIQNFTTSEVSVTIQIAGQPNISYPSVAAGQTITVGFTSLGNATALVTYKKPVKGSVKVTDPTGVLACEPTSTLHSFYPVAYDAEGCGAPTYITLSTSPC